VEEKEVGGQEEKNRMENIEEGSSFSPVAYSISTRNP